MKNMTLREIAAAVNGKLCGDFSDIEAQGVVIDNRKILENYVFIAIKGNRVDGHDLVNSTYEKGALGAIVEKEGDYNGPYILVDSTPAALRALATYYRKCLTIPVVGIIGSVGKTTTKEMTSSVLSEEYKVLKTEGNLNNDMGLPLTILSIKEEHEVAVVEMGISDFGEMDILGDIAKPDVVIYTCIGECHLENLHDRDGVLKAKTEVFKYLTKDATVIVSADDDKLMTIKESDLPNGGTIVTYSGIPKDSDTEPAMYQAVSIDNLGLEGSKVKFAGNVEGEVIVPIPGEHNVKNAMAAVAAGHVLHESTEHIINGIASFSTIAGRNNFIDVNGMTIIDDCYNANPMSMRAGLSILGKAKGRKIAVLGDMGELGADEVTLHRDLYMSVIENNIDIVYTAGDLSKTIVDALSDTTDFKGVAKAYTGDNAKEDLIADLKPTVQEGDTILVKASHFMEFPQIVEELKR